MKRLTIAVSKALVIILFCVAAAHGATHSIRVLLLDGESA
jgi:hypothetical protein